MASNAPSQPSNGPYTALPPNAANAAGAGGIMPSAGHYADMQTLMQNLDALSGWLQQNREEFDGLQEGLRRVGVEGMNGRHREPRLENGVAEGEDEQAHTISTLQQQLRESQSRIADLEATLTSHRHLQSLFQTTLTESMRLIRNYTYQTQTYITSLHHHYTRLLQDARFSTLEAQITHQKWQESLSNVNNTCREALEEREKVAGDEESGLRAELKGLRWENRVLRRKVGWKEPDYEEDEVLEEEALERWGEEEKERERLQGRAGRGSVGVGGGVGVGMGIGMGIGDGGGVVT